MEQSKVPSVCVIIAAWSAQATIARAVRSALAEPEVSEVTVVDDASPDATADAAAGADDGSGRLRVVRQNSNRGPSAARNQALAISRADYVAILDADDYLVPGRFAPLFAVPGWDAIADNVAFVPEARDRADATPRIAAFEGVPHGLSLAEFLAGSISRRGRARGELGFLKPVVRRAFLEANGLRYDESLRLGEDLHLYARMLAAGARFMLTPRCGYVAIERPGSLSGRHSADDLGALLAAVDRWAVTIPASGRAAFARYRAQLSANYRHRRLLDDKRDKGLPRALASLLDEPATAPRVLARIARDKLGAPAPGGEPDAVRYLLRG